MMLSLASVSFRKGVKLVPQKVIESLFRLWELWGNGSSQAFGVEGFESSVCGLVHSFSADVSV
jgi:hypothetical protein